jgi:23S rRNA pseudouridine955/2504/2580 synthase
VKAPSFREIILFENEHYIAVNKPALLSTLEDRNDPVNLLGMARSYRPGAQACHRIDKETSGVLVFARSPEAYRHLATQFERRTVEKTYHAVTDGIHSFRDLLVDRPLLKLSDGTVKIARTGKSAQTVLTTIRTYRQHTLVACRPVTGRMHQIRVHLSAQGAPITGDVLYGGKPFFLSALKRGYNLKKDTEERPVIERLALHAERIVFSDLNGERTEVSAPYPKDFRALLSQLEKNR